MKELFNFPQKKGKNFICHPINKTLLELNEIKITNFQQLHDKNGHFIECNIPINNNNEAIKIIKTMDNEAKTTVINNYDDWFENDITDESNDLIENLYVNSYMDNMPMTIILSNKIETEIYINEEEKEINEIINFLLLNKKNKNLLINIDIIFLGIYINKDNIINKWGLKYINIEELTEFNTDWNKEEIEEEWKYDLIHYEEEVNNKIEKLKRGLNDARTLYNEIINENNIKIWENKIDKLKNNILSIYDNR